MKEREENNQSESEKPGGSMEIITHRSISLLRHEPKYFPAELSAPAVEVGEHDRCVFAR